MASKSYSPAKKKATPAKKPRRIALTPVTKEEEKVVNEVFKAKAKPTPKPKAKPEPKPKAKPEPKPKAKPEPMSPKPKPKRRKNIQVLAIIDGLRQILDAYDGGIDSYSGDEDEDEIHYNYSGDEEGNDRTEYTEGENKRANFLDEMAHKFKWAARYEYDTGKRLNLYNPQDGSDSDVMSEDNQIDDTGVAKFF